MITVNKKITNIGCVSSISTLWFLPTTVLQTLFVKSDNPNQSHRMVKWPPRPRTHSIPNNSFPSRDNYRYPRQSHTAILPSFSSPPPLPSMLARPSAVTDSPSPPSCHAARPSLKPPSSSRKVSTGLPLSGSSPPVTTPACGAFLGLSQCI